MLPPSLDRSWRTVRERSYRSNYQRQLNCSRTETQVAIELKFPDCSHWSNSRLQNFSVLEMSSDEKATLFYWYLTHRKQKRKKYCVYPFFIFNLTHSSFVVARELDQDPVKFHNFYRMNIESFKLLVQTVVPEIGKKDTNFRKAMTVEYPSLQLLYKQHSRSTAWTNFVKFCIIFHTAADDVHTSTSNRQVKSPSD
jgi:hypothetical protein